MHRTLRCLGTAAALYLPAAPGLAAEGGACFYLLGSRTINAGVFAPPGAYLQASLYAFSGSRSGQWRRAAG